MTHAEIYRAIQQLLPQELLDKYGHLCYGEMAEVPELAPLGRRPAVGRNRVDEGGPAGSGVFLSGTGQGRH